MTCSSSPSISCDSGDPLSSISGQTWNDWGTASAPVLRPVRGFVAGGDQDSSAEFQPQGVIDVIEGRQASPQIRVAVLMGSDGLQGVALRNQVRRAGVDRPGRGILGTGWIRSFFKADVGRGPQRIAGPTEHRVLGVDRRQVELALRQVQVASPDEAEQRGMRGFVADRPAARRAPLEELLDIFGYIADGRLPVVEEDLHIDGLRIGADELRLRASLCAHAPARRIPLRTLLHGVFAWIELEVQPTQAVAVLELRLHHLHRSSLLLSTETYVVGTF